MKYVVKCGSEFVFEADCPSKFLLLWPDSNRGDYAADSLGCRKLWAKTLENWNGKKHHYHSDSALVRDMFKSGALDIVSQQPKWKLKKLEKSFCHDGQYKFRIDIDEINQGNRWYQMWTETRGEKRLEVTAGVSGLSVYDALRRAFGLQNVADYKSPLDRDYFCSEITSFCRSNDIKLPFTWTYFKNPERWAKEVLYYLHKNRIVKTV